MFRNIVIGVDLSNQHRAPLERVPELFDPQVASISLLHVIETIQDVPFEEIQDFYRPLQARAEEVLNRWAAELSAKGFAVRCEIVFGKRSLEIIRFAEANHCDLIVLTSHRVDPAEPGRGLATVSHQVAMLADCAVLLLR